MSRAGCIRYLLLYNTLSQTLLLKITFIIFQCPWVWDLQAAHLRDSRSRSLMNKDVSQDRSHLTVVWG